MSESTSPATAAESVPPPAEKPKNPEDRSVPGKRLARSVARLDRVLVGMVLLLAFFLASFVVRHSDYWMHLASGRLLAEGKYTFGVDPFAYTTAGVYWVNHSWLFDWALYGVTGLAGGPEAGGGVVAVVLKALLMTLLAGVMLALRRPGQGWFAPAVCVGLAVLAMAPRLMLQPIGASLLFLGLTLYFLARDGKKDAAGARGWRLLFTTSPKRLYVLPILFALWANVDAWFILGPIMVALSLVGEKLQQVLAPDLTGPDAAPPGEQRTLALVLGAGLAACLLNPHHVHVFTQLPVELLATSRFWDLHGDPRFAPLFVSPLSSVYLALPFGGNVCGMAYYPLLAGGVVSFWLTRAHWRVWRLLIWTLFVALSATGMLLVPLFAVVAGPIMALNFQDYAAGRAAPASPRELRLALATRLVTLLLGVVLLGAAWPGWLLAHSGTPALARRVGWGVEADPGLREAAYKLEYWRLQGWLKPEDHGFNFQPEAANYFAWFCPEEKGFFDGRYALFAEVAPAYLDVRQLLAGGGRHAAGSVPDYPKVFRAHGVTHVIFTAPAGSGPRWEATAAMVAQRMHDPDQWTLLYLDGRVSIFAWNDPQKKDADRAASIAFDLAPAVFGPTTVTAPEHGPGRPPRPRAWLDDYFVGPPLPSAAGDAAAMYQRYFDLRGEAMRLEFRKRAPFVMSLGVLGAVQPAAGALFSAGGLGGFGFLAGTMPQAFPPDGYPSDWDAGPPAVLLAAVRAGRRAVAADPDDADAYRALALATFKLWAYQENRWAHSRLPPGMLPGQLCAQIRDKKPFEPYLSPWLTRGLSFRHLVRRVQEVTALHLELAVRPDNPVLHEALFRVYWNMNFYDVAVDHLREEARLVRAAAARARDNKELQKTLADVEKLLADCEKQLQEVQRYYELVAAGKPAKVQAVGAFRPFGLAKQALAALLREDLSTLNPEEANLLIYLHLTLGKAEELRGQLTEGQKAVLGPVNYELYHVLVAAAVGDYADADAHLARVLEVVAKPAEPPLLHMLQGLTFGQLQPLLLTRSLVVAHTRQQFIEGHQALLSRQRLDDLVVLRGLLALDVGDVAAAARHFHTALDAAEPRYDFEARPIAERYLQLLNRGKGP